MRFETALAADYVGLSWMHVQDLARSGVKYLLNSHHITFPPPDGLPRKQLPFWWEGPDGSRVMVWRVEYTSAIYPWCTNPSNARFFSTREMGKPAAALEDMALTEVALKHQLKRLAEEGYDKDAVLLIDSHDNVRASNAVRLIEHFRKWNATHASPKLRLAVPEEFFRHMEAKYGKDLPVYRGEYRDQYAGPVFRRASGRQAATDLVEAEKLWSFNDLKGADTFPVMMDRQCMLDFFEMASHGGGAWWASQLQSDYTKFRRDQLQSMLPARAYYMRRMALAAVGQRILAPKPSLAVVNSLGWNRSGIVEIPVTEDFFTTRSQLRDAATGAIVPAEWATLDTPQPGEKLPGPMRDKKWFAGELGYGRLRFRADDVPAMGYKISRWWRRQRARAPQRSKP